MTLKEIGKKDHERCIRLGFYEQPKSALEHYALMHSELSEAVEEVRKVTSPVYFNTPHGIVSSASLSGSMNLTIGEVLQKPEGELIELADALIRICEYAYNRGFDLEAAVASKMAYNETRPYRHGKLL